MRLAFSIIAIAFIFVTPYYIYLPFIFVGIILFPLYVEAIALSLLVDILYGKTGSSFLIFPFGVISALLVLFAAPLRENLRFNA